MKSQTLFAVESDVRPEWIDANGHLNSGFYAVAFDLIAIDQFFDYLGLTREFCQREQKATFALGINIDYLQEVYAHDRLRFTSQLMDCDYKRLHSVHCMYNADKDYLAATNECLTMYIDMQTRRSTAFSVEQQERFALQLKADSMHAAAATFGRKLAIRR